MGMFILPSRRDLLTDGTIFQRARVVRRPGGKLDRKGDVPLSRTCQPFDTDYFHVALPRMAPLAHGGPS